MQFLTTVSIDHFYQPFDPAKPHLPSHPLLARAPVPILPSEQCHSRLRLTRTRTHDLILHKRHAGLWSAGLASACPAPVRSPVITDPERIRPSPPPAPPRTRQVATAFPYGWGRVPTGWRVGGIGGLASVGPHPRIPSAPTAPNPRPFPSVSVPGTTTHSECRRNTSPGPRILARGPIALPTRRHLKGHHRAGRERQEAHRGDRARRSTRGASLTSPATNAKSKNSNARAVSPASGRT